MDSRWTILISSCFLNFAQDFFQDVQSPLNRRLTGKSDACKNGTDHCLSLNNVEYNALSTASTWSSAAATVITALFIAQHGHKVAIWTAAGLMLIGALLFASGSYAETPVAFALLLIGRIFFGFGNGISITTTGTLISSAWNNRVTAESFYVLSGRVGSALTFLLVGGVVNSIGMSGTLWLAFGIIVLGAIAGIILGTANVEQVEQQESPKQSVWNFLCQADGLFWSFVIAYFLVHSTVTTYTNNGQSLLAMRNSYNDSSASFIVGIVPDVSIIIPLVGFLVDFTGRRDYWMTGGTTLILFAFATYLGVETFKAWLLSLFIGLGFALFDPTASASTSVVSPRQTSGIANAVIKFFRYVMVGLVTLSAGVILDREDKYQDPRAVWKQFVILLFVISVMALLAGIALIMFNRRSESQPLRANQVRRDSDKYVQEFRPLKEQFSAGSDWKRRYLPHKL